MNAPTPLNLDSRSGIRPGNHRVDFEEKTVVFLVGMRINSLWRVKEWLPAMMAMPRMLAELRKRPGLGLLSFANWIRWREVVVIQYWKDMDHLMSYATAAESEHLPAWKGFNRRTRNSDSVGIWHEAYEVHPQTSHIVYRDMPPSGMGAAARLMNVANLPPQPVKRRGKGPDDTDLAASA